MRRLTHAQKDHLRGLRKRIESVLGELTSPTQEAAEKAVRAVLSAGASDAAVLVPFTGYYAINGDGTAPDAFFSIATSEVFVNYEIAPNRTLSVSYPTITINTWLNGSTPPASYPFADGGSFDGTTLIIPGVVNVNLTREYEAGQMVTLAGTIQDVSVSGATFFNPVELWVFTGNYTSEKTQTTVLTVASSSLKFDSGSGLQNVEFFTYDPAMYVVAFAMSDAAYVLMLGTNSEGRLVCFITDGTTEDLAVKNLTPTLTR